MRVKFIAIVTSLIVLLLAAGSVLAVGYESYGTTVDRQSRTKVYPRTEKGLCEALTKASFVEKYPAIVDELAFTVRDILSQFGLAKNTKP